jgi:hypothetical protein
MESTISRMAKTLGASSVEAVGHDARFAVIGSTGDRMTVSLKAQEQRLMAVLVDAQGVIRASIDVAPVNRVVEDVLVPGHVKVLVGRMVIQLDTRPTLAIEVGMVDEE